MYIKGLKFECICGACPEQYDVFDRNDNLVGYVRLRWGYLRCDYRDAGGEAIYEADIGDGWTGSFEDDAQRIEHLNNIADAILKKINKEESTMMTELQKKIWYRLCELDGEEVARLFTNFYGNQLLSEEFKEWLEEEGVIYE
jgi:hypothetical protein